MPLTTTQNNTFSIKTNCLGWSANILQAYSGNTGQNTDFTASVTTFGGKSLSCLEISDKFSQWCHVDFKQITWASIKKSKVWKFLQIYQLPENEKLDMIQLWATSTTGQRKLEMEMENFQSQESQTPSGFQLLFALKSMTHQFPVRSAFTMSINKSQGQTLRKVGAWL